MSPEKEPAFVRYLKTIKICMLILILCPVFLQWPEQAHATGGKEKRVPEIDFTKFSLEELKNVKITSASKTPEKLSKIPAAVFVITQEDIKRSGATSIPEVLRMAPGVQVARISATEWAVNIRGLNELYSNKLLVLIDGRSVYTNALSGVFWDVQDTVLEDIDRIEIIRGPGAALWGANAVNGVINIITKNASKTQGWQLTLLGGNQEGIFTARYGDIAGDDGFYRAYAKGFLRGRLFEGDRDIKNDPSKSDWQSGRGGFRFDFEPEDHISRVMVEGEAYANKFDTKDIRFFPAPPYFREDESASEAYGGHLITRWQYKLSDNSDAMIRFYYDFYSKDIGMGNVRAHTFDFDSQHRFVPFENHEILWGINARFISDKFAQTFDMEMDPQHKDQYFLSVFFQDRMRIIPDKLNLTIGSKFEYNRYTGMEIQPSLRMIWFPRENHALWGAISRAARVPSRIESDVEFNSQVPPSSGANAPVIVRYLGNNDLEAETLTAYELGYRIQPAENWWVNMTGFYHDYKDLIALELARPPFTEQSASDRWIVPFKYRNNKNGHSVGFEMAAYWEVMSFWKLKGAYTLLETNLENETAQPEDESVKLMVRRSNPHNQFSLISSVDISENIEFDLWFRYVDRLSEEDVGAYSTIDTRISWKPRPLMEISLVGQNLLEEKHSEFSSLKVERSFYLKLDWCF